MKIVTAAQMMELDRRTTEEDGIPEKTLIARAGKAAADWILSNYSSKTWRVLVLTGKGNNGADALVTAKWLKKWAYSVKIVKAWEKDAIKIVDAEIRKKLSLRVLVIDGLFGTGLNRILKDPFLSLIRLLSSSDLEIVSLDIPSGLNADLGKPMGAALSARHTLTFGLPKLGLIQEHAANDVGQLHVLDIGFPKELIQRIHTSYNLITQEEVAPFFKPRKRTSHKGDLGHVLVIGGSKGFAGAPILAARAALRAGAGLVSLAVPEKIYVIASRLAGPEVMVHPCSDAGKGYFGRKSFSNLKTLLSRATALVLGPGLGQNPETQHFVEMVVKTSSMPIVLDADALNLIAKKPSILRLSRQEIIITPHPGEMGRLTKKSVKGIQQNRFGIAGSFVKEYKVTVILKGARTVIAHTEGGFSVNALAGNPGMAIGGSGDALAGIIVALLGRGLLSGDAARAGVFLHARAGDLALKETGGGIVSDLIEVLPQAISSFNRL